MKIIVEGIDRLGKDTLIDNIIDRLGYHSVIHYSAPKKTKFYAPNHNDIEMLHQYQWDSFWNGFHLLNGYDKFNLIFNRFHLGEVVYAKRYRHYCGRYVFEMEKQFEVALKETRLILLYTSNTHMLQDDGKSHDFTQRNEEQEDFLDAFERSKIENKFMFDVYNTFSDTYHSREYIAENVVNWLMSKN